MSGQSTPHENGLLKDYERPWKMNNAIELHLVNITIEILVVFSLFDMGLRLNLRDALSNLRNVRFTVLFLMWGLLCPRLAYLTCPPVLVQG